MKGKSLKIRFTEGFQSPKKIWMGTVMRLQLNIGNMFLIICKLRVLQCFAVFFPSSWVSRGKIKWAF